MQSTCPFSPCAYWSSAFLAVVVGGEGGELKPRYMPMRLPILALCLRSISTMRRCHIASGISPGWPCPCRACQRIALDTLCSACTGVPSSCEAQSVHATRGDCVPAESICVPRLRSSFLAFEAERNGRFSRRQLPFSVNDCSTWIQYQFSYLKFFFFSK